MLREVLKNEQIAHDIFKMEMETWDNMRSAQPGQFMHIRCSEFYDPLLRRPFSIHRLERESVAILYKVIGKGTAILSKLSPGEVIDVIGPLGSGFNLNMCGGLAMMVAGGMGVAPFVFLAQALKLSKKVVLIGAKRRENLVCVEDLKKLGCTVEIATDDGSCGERGYVSKLFQKRVGRIKPAAVYACGPRQMLSEIGIISRKNLIACQVSLENQMGCGLGACLGCVIKTRKKRSREEYSRVCKDGPVFRADEVLW